MHIVLCLNVFLFFQKKEIITIGKDEPTLCLLHEGKGNELICGFTVVSQR